MKHLRIAGIILLFILQLPVHCQPSIRVIPGPPQETGLYEKVELPLQITAEFTNPFDPDELNIMATFTAPSGKEWKVPGFYNQVRRGGFLVRFSPDETGAWRYAISITDKTGTSSGETGSFNVIPSEYHGPVRIAQNKRYLEQGDGTPWFGVGLWYNGENDAKVLDELQSKGVNFISKLIVPLETWGTGLGRYDQMTCRQIDELLEELEKRDMQLALNFWFHSFLSETVWGGGNIAWYTNPYQLVCDAKDFYSSDEAWKYQEKLYRYMIARWGYSRSLAIWFVVDEVNGTDGWMSGDSLGAANWAGKIHSYFKQHDPWNHPTTGTRSGGSEEWWNRGYEIFDMAGREIYEAQGFPINETGRIDMDKTHPLTYSYLNYHGQVRKLWNNYEKPAIIPETGWDHTFYEMSMPGYQAQFHNALWVTMASGSAMSPFWWGYSDQLNDNVVTNQLRSLRKFTGQIPFSKLTHPAPLEADNPGGHAFAIGSDQLIYGWAVNADSDMSGRTVTIRGIKNGEYRLKLYHTWSGRFLEVNGKEEALIRTAKNALSFTVPVLKISDGHAQYVGQDIAFIIEPAGQ
jgi:hypothetical protein